MNQEPTSCMCKENHTLSHYLKTLFFNHFSILNISARSKARRKNIMHSTTTLQNYFLNLETGKKVHAYDWVELAISDRVNDMVHKLADKDKAPALDEQGCPVFQIDISNDDLVPLPEGELEEGFEDNAVIPKPTAPNNIPLPPNSSSVNSNSSNDSDDMKATMAATMSPLGKQNNQTTTMPAVKMMIQILMRMKQKYLINQKMRATLKRMQKEKTTTDSEVRNNNEEEAWSGNDRPSHNVKPPSNYEPSMSEKTYSFMQKETEKSLYATAVNIILN